MLEDPVLSRPHDRPHPRATRIAAPGLAGSIWVGGGWADFGQVVELDHVRGATVVDCAGVLTPELRDASGTWVSCVFDDLDDVPVRLDFIREIASGLATSIRDHGADVYVFCQYGMNRSNLVAGLVLRNLGVAASDIVPLLRAHRPGALANEAYCRLLESGG